MAVVPSQKPDRRSELARLSHDNLLKAVLLLAWPVIIEMAMQSTVGIADVAMVGRLGPASIAAVGLCNQISMLAMTVFAAVRTGSTVLVARLVGANDLSGATRAARQSLIISILIALILVALGVLFPAAGMRLLGAEEDVVATGIGYMRWKAISILFAIIVMTTTGILRGCGDTLTSLYANATINLINIGLNWIFIFGNLGMPNMGTAGAGFATMVARAVGTVIMMQVLLSGKASIKLKLLDSNRLHFPTIKRILNVGIPAAVEQLMMRGAQVFFTMIVTGLGTNMYAAHQIAMRADSLAVMPGFGFAVAATTLVGQNLGARQPEVANRAGWLTLYLGVGFMAVVGVSLFTFAVPAARFFTDEPEVIVAAASALRTMALALPFMAVARVSAGALRGAGDVKYVMWGTGLSVWIARLGLAFIFVRLFNWGLVGAWVGMASDQIVRAAVFGIRYWQGKWKGISI
ncbi:MAG: MATE family efflux transporter [Bacillota bacterium]